MKRILLLIAVGVFTACSSASSKNEKIIKRLEKLALTYPKLVDALEPETKEIPKQFAKYASFKFVRRKIQITDTGYDVRKTDSLVSPFIGEIAYTVVTRGRKGSLEKDVKEGPENFKVDGIKCKATYAYQSSRWVRKSVACLSSDNTWEVPEANNGSIYTASELLPQE